MYFICEKKKEWEGEREGEREAEGGRGRPREAEGTETFPNLGQVLI